MRPYRGKHVPIFMRCIASGSCYTYIIKEVANGPVGRQPIMLGNRSGYCKEMAQKSHVVKHIFSADYGGN